MARRLNMVFLVAIAITALLLQSTMAKTTYVVGDSLGWVIPPNGAAAYTAWAANKTFVVGDILVFNFANGGHDVAEVTKANFDACNTNSPISLTRNSPANITLNATGEHHYICTFTGHCSGGQKLAINVSAASSSPSPQPSIPSPFPVLAPAPQSRIPSPAPQPGIPSPVPMLAPVPQPGIPSPVPMLAPIPSTSAPTPSPSRSPISYTVGDTSGWSILANGSIAYQTWASGKTFMVGDTLVFNYVNGTHNVAEVTKQGYESCNTTSPISLNSNPPTTITLTTAGEHFFTCTYSGHCSAGQQLAIKVTDSSTATPPPSSTVPSSPSPTSLANSPPPPNSATSLGVAGLSATFLSIVVALLY